MTNILKIIFFSLFGISLRVIFYYSEYRDYLKSLLIFDQAPYNFDNIKENYIYNLFHKTSMKSTDSNDFFNNTNQEIVDDNYYSEYEFISKPISILYKYIKNQQEKYIFIFFIICDLLIAYLINAFKYHCIPNWIIKEEKNNNEIKKEEEEEEKEEEKFNMGVFCFYLCNPISITSCISFNLDVFYTLINLLLGYFSSNLLLGSIFAFISLIISPGYIFITVIFYAYLLIQDFKKYHKNVALISLLFYIYIKFGQDLVECNPLESLKNLYYNYYMFKDVRPNLGMLWVLLPSTFLKYQNYTLIMYLIYQLAFSIAVMLHVNRINIKSYKYKNSLVYILIFYITHIIDRYPSENHLIVIICMLLQHYEIIKVKSFDLGVYCSFASYPLIVFRGFPYLHRISGSSNYLFYQNLTYAVAQIMIIMFSLTGINDYRNKCKKNEKDEGKDGEKKKINEIKINKEKMD